MSDVTLMSTRVVNVEIGHPRHEELIGRIRADDRLRQEMWERAGHRFEEQPGKVWTVAEVWGGGRSGIAAWCAAAEETGETGLRVLRCSDGYEPLEWADLNMYPQVYAHRHTTLGTRSTLPARTFLHVGDKGPDVGPIPLHLADGWHRTGNAGTSRETGREHHWEELHRHAPGCLVAQHPGPYRDGETFPWCTCWRPL